MKRRSLFALCIALSALIGCHSVPVQPFASSDQPLGGDRGVADARISGAVGSDGEGAAAPVVAYGNNRMVGVKRPRPVTGGDVTLDFVDTDVHEIANTVFSKILKVPYTIDSGVHGTVSLSTPYPVARSQVLPILENVLLQANAAVVESNGLYQVLPLSAAATRPVMGGIDGGTGGADLVQLRYASADDLSKMLQPFVAHGGKIAADANRNALIVAGDPVTRATLTDMVRAFDVDILAGQSYALFPVTSGTPAKVASELEKALLTEKDRPLADQVRVIPMPRINAVLVASRQARYIDDARRLIDLVDRAGTNSASSWHVYYVQNGQSADLEYLLQRAFTPNHVTSNGLSDTHRLSATAPGLSAGGIGSQQGGSSAGTGGVSGLNNPLTGASPGTDQPDSNADSSKNGDAALAATQSLSPADSSDSASDRIRIIANKRNNALLIYAPPDQYAVIEAMLQKLDIVPLQVQIDATIAEVTLNNTLEYGTQFFFKNGGLTGTLSQGASSAFASGFPGFVLSKSTSAVQFALNALKDVSSLRVLSSPQITVLDNEQATIQVGDNVPYVTQSSTSTVTNTADVINSVNYQQTGVILQVLPRVNSGGLVALDISQEVSLPVTTTSSTIDSPTFQDRKVQSRVVVQDGQTLGLAGLIRDSKDEANSGIPFIKDVPILGTLFSNQNNSRQRTELLVLLTPHVLYGQRGARMLTDDLRNELMQAGRVPGELQSFPIGISANPNAVFSR